MRIKCHSILFCEHFVNNVDEVNSTVPIKLNYAPPCKLHRPILGSNLLDFMIWNARLNPLPLFEFFGSKSFSKDFPNVSKGGDNQNFHPLA